jgi:nitrogen regulatory protein P-II 1
MATGPANGLVVRLIYADLKELIKSSYAKEAFRSSLYICIMKQIDIIIPHKRLKEVNNIPYKHKAGGLSFYDIKGRGRAELKSMPVRVQGYATGRTYVPKFETRTKLEVLVPDSLVKPLIHDLLS